MIISLAVLGLGCALVMQSLGWAQTSYMAFSKALDHGTPQIDRWHWETRDKSYYRRPLLLGQGARAADGDAAAVRAAARGRGRDGRPRRRVSPAKQGGKNPWAYRGLQIANYGNNRERARSSPARRSTTTRR